LEISKINLIFAAIKFIIASCCGRNDYKWFNNCLGYPPSSGKAAEVLCKNNNNRLIFVSSPVTCEGCGGFLWVIWKWRLGLTRANKKTKKINKGRKSCGLGKNLVTLWRISALDSVQASLATFKFIKRYGQNIL